MAHRGSPDMMQALFGGIHDEMMGDPEVQAKRERLRVEAQAKREAEGEALNEAVYLGMDAIMDRIEALPVEGRGNVLMQVLGFMVGEAMHIMGANHRGHKEALALVKLVAMEHANGIHDGLTNMDMSDPVAMRLIDMRATRAAKIEAWRQDRIEVRRKRSVAGGTDAQ